MDKKTYNNLSEVDFGELEWSMLDILRADSIREDTLAHRVSIAALALLLKETKDGTSLIEYVEDKIKDETTFRFLKKVDKDYNKYIEEISEKYDFKTLQALVLYSETTRFTEVDMHSTPNGINNLAIEILDINNNDVVLDLGSGYNSFLIQAAQATDCETLYGVEINTDSLIIANIRSFISKFKIKVTQGNAISQNFSNLGANKVFSNPPLGIRLRDLENYINKNSSLKKYFSDVRSTVSGDWVFNMAAYLNMQIPGKTVVLMTNAGTWNKPDEELRQKLIEKGIVEGVILLPERLMSMTRIPLTMMILSQDNKSVKMVDASEIFTEGRRQNTLESNDILKILEAYNNDTDISRYVPIKEIEEQEYILNPQRYIGADMGIKDGISLGDISISINRGAMIRSNELDELISIEETNNQYLMLQNIQDGLIDSNLPNLIEIEERYTRYCIKDKNLIISKLSPFKIAMAHIEEGTKVLANGNLYFIDLDDSKVNPIFVEVFLQSEIGIAQLNRFAKGAAMKSISIQDLKMIQIPNLPRDLQDRIAEEYINLTDELVVLQRQEDMIRDKKARLLEEVI